VLTSWWCSVTVRSPNRLACGVGDQLFGCGVDDPRRSRHGLLPACRTPLAAGRWTVAGGVRCRPANALILGRAGASEDAVDSHGSAGWALLADPTMAQRTTRSQGFLSTGDDLSVMPGCSAVQVWASSAPPVSQCAREGPAPPMWLRSAPLPVLDLMLLIRALVVGRPANHASAALRATWSHFVTVMLCRPRRPHGRGSGFESRDHWVIRSLPRTRSVIQQSSWVRHNHCVTA
jgi:hypothetical protein